jgi:hypothetical protein
MNSDHQVIDVHSVFGRPHDLITGLPVEGDYTHYHQGSD